MKGMRRNKNDEVETAPGRKLIRFTENLLYIVALPVPTTDQDIISSGLIIAQSLTKRFDGRNYYSFLLQDVSTIPPTSQQLEWDTGQVSGRDRATF